MKRGALLARVIVVVAALSTQGSLCSSGPDCGGACDVVRNCHTLNKTFFLSCSSLAPTCDTATANCAACLTGASVTCAGLAAGQCDSVCVPNFNGGTAADAGTLDGGGADAGAPDAGP
jgi:hypothetical protein